VAVEKFSEGKGAKVTPRPRNSTNNSPSILSVEG